MPALYHKQCTFSTSQFHSNTQRQLQSTIFLIFLGVLLYGNCCCCSPVPTSDTDPTCPTDFEDACDNLTVYNQVQKSSAGYIGIAINITLEQLRAKADLSYVIEQIHNFYPGETIGFAQNTDNQTTNTVCQSIGRKLSPNDDLRRKFRCPWEYRCDYDPRRVPQVLWQADCGVLECHCKTVYYTVPVLYNRNCDPFEQPGNWEWTEQKVAVACAYINEREIC